MRRYDPSNDVTTTWLHRVTSVDFCSVTKTLLMYNNKAHKFDKVAETTTERAKPAQNVASAKRSASTGRKKTVRLTPSQVAIAKRLGVPLEAYAKQLKITEGA